MKKVNSFFVLLALLSFLMYNGIQTQCKKEARMENCYICPRNCGADRTHGELGLCRSPADLMVSKIMLHEWEEPCISGRNGAGTIFFSGCNLHCVYCQNNTISCGNTGKTTSEDELENEIFKLCEIGSECIEFVTPTHYTETIAKILEKIKHRITIPVVWNSGGYEKTESLKMLEDLVDVYLPDFKYFDSSIAKKYSFAPDYKEVAISAIKEMSRQVGEPHFDDGGKLLRGLIVRHLVLPSHRTDSIEVIKLLDQEIGHENMLLGLMSQYTPDFYIDSKSGQEYKNLCRRITSFEYESVAKIARELGFDGYFQEHSSASKKYTPEF